MCSLISSTISMRKMQSIALTHWSLNRSRVRIKIAYGLVIGFAIDRFRQSLQNTHPERRDAKLLFFPYLIDCSCLTYSTDKANGLLHFWFCILHSVCTAQILAVSLGSLTEQYSGCLRFYFQSELPTTTCRSLSASRPVFQMAFRAPYPLSYRKMIGKDLS